MRVIAVIVVAVATACSASDDAGEASSVTPSSTLPTTTLATTTTTPGRELVVERVAELAGRALTSPFADGSSIVALSEADTGVRSIVRLDTAGAVTQDVPIADAPLVSTIASAGGRRFVYGFFVEPGYPFVCGLREIDPAALALGPTIRLPTDSGCGGEIIADDVNPAVLITADVRERTVFRVDTGDGTVTRISLEAVVPPGYEVRELVTLEGTTYALLVASVDPVSGEEATAPDGTPLRPLIVRIDGATGAVSAAPVSGRFVVDDGRLVVRLSDTHAQVIDPITLTPTEIAAAELGVADEDVATAGGVAWSFAVDDAGGLTVALRDPTTERVADEASVDTGFGGDPFVSYRAVVLGSDLYVVAARRMGDAATTSVTRLYRATLRPAS